MKKFLTIGMIGLTAIVRIASFAQAATSVQGPFTVSAAIPTTLTLTVVMRRNDFSGPIINNMSFGNLTNDGGTLSSDIGGGSGTGAVAVFLTANSQGAPYSILQTGTPMSNGTATLPAGACIVRPIYAAADNGGLTMPAGASLGTTSTFTLTTPKLLYQSEGGTAQLRTIQAIYSITDDPAAGATAVVPTSQPAGTYSSTVTYTLTT